MEGLRTCGAAGVEERVYDQFGEGKLIWLLRCGLESLPETWGMHWCSLCFCHFIGKFLFFSFFLFLIFFLQVKTTHRIFYVNLVKKRLCILKW